MKKVCKYTVAAAIIAFLLYHSIYFENLEDVKQQQQREAFNAAEYARDFWDNQLFSVLDKAVDAKELIELFNTNMNEAIKKYGKTPGVSRIYAYLIRGNGRILTIGKDFLQVSIREPKTNPDIKITTGFYIPGNAVRDASGLIDVSEFSDTMKFNEISGEINKAGLCQHMSFRRHDSCYLDRGDRLIGWIDSRSERSYHGRLVQERIRISCFQPVHRLYFAWSGDGGIDHGFVSWIFQRLDDYPFQDSSFCRNTGYADNRPRSD